MRLTTDAALAGAGTTFDGELPQVNTFRDMILYANVTAVSGTSPSMTISFQDRDPGSKIWIDIPSSSFTAITATGIYRFVMPLFGVRIRPKYVITGTTPSFTFTLTGTAIA